MIDALFQVFVAPLTQLSFQKALVGGCLVAVVSAVIGCYVILRRMAFLGDALAHTMLAGVTAGYLFMQILFGVHAHALAMLLGSLFAGLATVLLIGFVTRISRIKEDTAIGIMYAGIFSVGAILASYFSDRIHVDLYHFVIGSVLSIDESELWLMAIVATLVLGTVILFFRHLQITSFDPVMAASLGISVLVFNYLLTACTSLVVVSAVPLVGVILVVGLLVTPAGTAYLICDRLSRMQIVAAVFGVSSVVGGLYVSTWIGNIATGPSIVLFSTVQFLIVLAIAPRYGLIADWLRRRSMVPQELVEDVLRCFRVGTEPVSLSVLGRYVEAPPRQIRRAVKWLARRHLLTEENGKMQLTDEGHREAHRILRAHRIWETYLQHVGLPEDQVHAQAHLLEHLHDEATVDYLDDKLGHPLTDPHGTEIPEDIQHVVPGMEVRASLLREGHRGTVLKIGPETPVDLKVGERIEMGARRDNGRLWIVRRTNGRELALDHHAADSVVVRLDKT